MKIPTLKIEKEKERKSVAAAFEKAIDLAGGQKQLADLCKVKQQSISKSLKLRKVSPLLAKKIEKAVNGEVKRIELCPEIFGD